MIKYLMPILALLGVGVMLMSVAASKSETRQSEPIAPPAQSSFTTFIAGAGLIEASSENIAIGTLVPGIVQSVAVKVGDTVAAGQVMFVIDDRDLRAQVAIRQSELASAEADYARLQQSPRPEDIPPLEAAVDAARETLADREREKARVSKLGSSASIDELSRSQLGVAITRANLAQAEANLVKAKAGTWAPELAVAKAKSDAAAATLAAAQIALDRLSVKAPIAGTVLQVKTRPGEFAQTGPLTQPLILLGETQTLHVRVDIDENDAWRLKPGAKAEAFLRGNASLKIPVTFVRVEPYVIPKRSLTGDSTERVDTRVLQVLFAFKQSDFQAAHPDASVYVGQQMDVFIDAPAIK